MQLVIEQALVTYGQVTALNVSGLALRSGVTGLVGLNGAGKSTLLTGLASGGASPAMQLVVDSKPVKAGRARAQLTRRTALMPQAFDLPSRFTVRETVTYLAWLRGLPRSAISQAVADVLEAINLADRAGSRIGDLSGGMLRRVGLAQALVATPELLLLDEPTAGLDPEQRLIFRELLSNLPDTASTIVSSHLMEDVLRVSDQLLLLHEGSVRFHGTIEEFWLSAQALGVPAGADPEMAFLALTRRAAAA